MKKLTKSKRDTVRFLLKRALNDLKVAKDFTFKAYGSSDTTFDLKFAIGNLESALSNLPKTKLPRNGENGLKCPANGGEWQGVSNAAADNQEDRGRRHRKAV